MDISPLEAIAAREADLLRHVESIDGTMEQKDAVLASDGTTDAYRQVELEYLELASAGSVEALKRALFLGWYSRAEPTCFTGLAGIEDSQFIESQELGLARVDFGDADDEFLAMLAWYATVYDRSLGGSDGADRFAARLADAPVRPRTPIDRVSRSSLEHRGAMGRYFISMLRDPA